MKKVLLILLAVIVIVAALGAAGMVGYRYGYSQGVLSSTNGDSTAIVPRFGMNPHGMYMRGFDRDFGRGDLGMMGRGGMGFGFFSPLMFLARIAFWALAIWAIYMLIARSGWRLTKTQPAPVASPAPAEPPAENKES